MSDSVQGGLDLVGKGGANPHGLYEIRLQKLFREEAVAFGDFTLASGKKSRYYVDARRVLQSPAGLYNLGHVLYDRVRYREPGASPAPLAFDLVGGPETGAIPMTAALLLALYNYGGHDGVRGFYVRGEPKGHGAGRLVEGAVKAGDRAVVLEDVTATGASALRAVRSLEELGVTVVRVVSLCDRLQGAAAALAGYDYRPVFTVRDFGIEPDPEG